MNKSIIDPARLLFVLRARALRTSMRRLDRANQRVKEILAAPLRDLDRLGYVKGRSKLEQEKINEGN